MVYLLNFNITYIIILATCFDSFESSSGLNSRTIVIVLQFFVLQFLSYSNYFIRDPFMHYKTRANVCMVLGGAGFGW